MEAALGAWTLSQLTSRPRPLSVNFFLYVTALTRDTKGDVGGYPASLTPHESKARHIRVEAQ